VNPKTDIVMPVHGALSYTKHCVETVNEHTKNFRWIFVDDYSDEITAAWLREEASRHPDSLLIRTNKQRWFTRASNLGLRMVRTTKAVLLNSDCEVNTGWLEELYSVWNLFEQEHPDKALGLVGATLSEADPRPYIEHHVSQPSYVTGHCWLMDMTVMEWLAAHRGTPGWIFNEKDQGQIHIASDRILCWDLNKAGYSTVASFHAKVGHVGGASWGHDLGKVSGLTLNSVD